MTVYDLKSLSLPVLAGAPLKIFASLLAMPLVGRLLLQKLVADAGIPKLLDAQLDTEPTYRPLVTGGTTAAANEAPSSELPNCTGMPSVQDYARAYRDGVTTPEKVAEATLNSMQQSDSGERPLGAFISSSKEEVYRQAQESAERHQKGQSLGPFDGVPVAIKDELDMVPYPTSVGTAFLGDVPAERDATVVARLRAAGALLIGKTNMYELGINPESHNMHHGVVRNPYNLAHQTGGSSSGSAAAAAAGLCPVAIGADGGGSIRIPASFCGLVGLKSTYGRVSEYGAAPLCWTLAHLGPLGASTEDVALTFKTCAGPDPLDPATQHQPSPQLGNWAQDDLRGVRLGVFRPWYEHASPDIVAACDRMLAHFEDRGAIIKNIEIPQLDLMRIAQAVTILSEMATAMEPHRHHFSRHAPAVQINLRAGREFKARHYVLAAQVRTLALRTFARLYESVDAIVTPTAATTAPAIREDSLKTGWSNINDVTEVMRHIFIANLTGHPAITFPVGYSRENLPIGMQLMARHWDEALLLRSSWVAEQHFQRRRPATFFRSF